ncbi:MAG: UDP-2,3-diacylglucosamine diphosphatase LpxI [Phycisphaeraceae bacterium]|nr:UDP-2,3-diacylglucosamine diphosphatase LpxI [Phycisphaeraceae bacterium]MCW5762630.1 UDP-2,3-diacylglucosamine diphosphatase LpxI [Phycisphaeraceae bacterium]
MARIPVPSTAALTILPDPPGPPTPIGLIAGGGQLPIAIARGLREIGHPVHGLGLSRQYSRDLPRMCSSFHEVALLRIGSWARILRNQGVRHAIMVGNVDKAKLMHDPWRALRNIPDFRTAVAWYRHIRHDRRSHAVLAAIAEELDKEGVSLLDSTFPIPDQIASAGVMTQKRPTPAQMADIEFVWPILSDMLRLDIGQSIAVRDRDVIAVEAVEGTDRMIERVGRLCKARGWVLCKGARVGHDRRSDVPTVGVRTIEHMYANGGRCLAVAVGNVIMLEREKMIDAADRLGVSIIGVSVSIEGPKTAGAVIREAKPLVSSAAR